MANVHLPRAVVALGGVICVAGGYLLGVVVTSGSTDMAVAEVVSFDASSSELCLRGDAVADAIESDDLPTDADADDEVCGYWMQPQEASEPSEGDDFEFTAHATDSPPEGVSGSANVLIYGTVVD